MSWNSMSRLGCDVVLGDIQAQNISCKSITVDDASNPTIPTELTIDTINCQTGNIETLTSQTIDSSIITATEKLLVSNNAMILNNTNTSSTTQLLGNSAETVGEYLTEVYPESTGTNISYTVQQLSAGDNASQSLLFSGGGGYGDDVKNTIQSYDSYRKIAESLWLNPLGGDVRVGDTLSGTTANFDVINVATLNVSNPDDPDDPTIPTDLNVNSITATSGNIENLMTDIITSSSVSVSSSLACNSLTSQSATSDYITANEKLLVSNNAMILNNCLIDSTTDLLGNSAETVGDYLTSLYPGSTSSYVVQQLAGGDNGASSLIYTSGGLYEDDKNTIQSYDTTRSESLDLHLNPLGGTTFITDLKPVNQIMGAACYMIKPNFACSTFICTIRALSNDDNGFANFDQDNDQDLLWCVNPGFKIIVYNDGDFNGTAEEYDNTNGLVPKYFNGNQNATSIQVFFNSVEINPFNF